MKFKIPPHINAEPHKRLMEWLEKAAPEEIFQTAVQAGIYTPDGELTEHYKGSDEKENRCSDKVVEEPKE